VISQRHIYLLGSPWNTLVKIGCSRQPDVRFGSIACASPFPVKLLWVSAKGVDCESYLHRSCKEFHVHGEWFDFKEVDPIAHVQKLIAEEAHRASQPRPEIPNPRQVKAEADFAVIKAIDFAIRRGDPVKIIATRLQTTPSGVRSRLLNRGFKVAKKGNPRLIDVMYERDFSDWLESGQLFYDRFHITSEAVAQIGGAQ
jgi:hypothetical protein